MFSILNRALSWAITSFGNEFCLKKRSRLIKALDNRFFVKFMQLDIGLLCMSKVLDTFCFEIEEVTKKTGKKIIFKVNLELHEKIMANL